jgi:hypothetical protein
MSPTLSRRQLLGWIGASAAAASVPVVAARKPLVEVWKSESCGCCGAWVEHLEANGFQVKVNNVRGPAEYREKLGLPDEFGSCHTAQVQGYVLEGHVPAREIHRLLAERPAAIGLAVPGMPIGSPGMDMGDRRDAYDVILVGRDRKGRVYQHYTALTGTRR